MKKIAIVCDNWKKATFEAELKAYHYTEGPGPAKGTTTLKIITDEANFERVKNEIHAICIKVENGFLENKKKNN